jgi:sulfonate transport system substrate-binding protein
MKIAHIILVLALAWVAAARAEEPLVIRHGYVGFDNGLSPMVFQKKSVMRHLGKSYTIDPLHFAGTSVEVTALAAGEVDIITCGFSSVAAAVLNAHMADIRILADGFQDGVDGYFSTTYMVQKDSPIAKVEDLKGKVVAVNAIGGALDVALRAMLRQHGLEDRRDYSVVEAGFAPMVPMLLAGKVDLIGEVPRFVLDPLVQAKARTLFTERDAVGPTQQVFLAARAGFLAQHRSQLLDFFEDEIRGLHWFLDPANRTEAIALIAAAMKTPPERYASYLFTKQDFYRDPDAKPNIPALQHDMETELSLGFIKEPIDIAKYVDLSFVEEGAKRAR